MPLTRCKVRGKPGWRWGQAGKCYIGVGAKKKAIKQGIAVEGAETVRAMLSNDTHAITAHARGNGQAPNPLRRDPTRTATLRRQFETDLRKRFERFKKRLKRLVVEEDAFGLKQRQEIKANTLSLVLEEVLANYSPSQPRDSRGRWTSGGGGGGAVTSQKQKPKLSFERSEREEIGERNAKLREEYEAIKEHLDEIVEAGVENGWPVSGGWVTLSQEDQDILTHRFVEADIDSAIDLAVEDEVACSSSYVREQIARGSEYESWRAQERWKWAEGHGIDPQSLEEAIYTPFTPGQRTLSSEVFDSPYGEPERGRRIDWSKVRDTEGRPVTEVKAGWESEWRTDISRDPQQSLDDWMDDSIEDKYQDWVSDLPNDMAIRERAEDALFQQFGLMDSEQKTAWVKQNHPHYVSKMKRELKRPEFYKGLQDGEDYARTRAVARYIQQKRSEEILRERLPNLDVDLDKTSEVIWEGWKGSSTTDIGLALRRACSEELGAYGRLDDSGRERADAGYRSLARQCVRNPQQYQSEAKAPADVSAIGKEIARAHVRATWEGSQYVLDKAGMPGVEVYRGLQLDYTAIPGARQKSIDYEVGPHTGYVPLPDLHLRRNGCVSTTADLSTANGWNGVGLPPKNPTRVVLRMELPRETVFSLPCFGQNVHDEVEVVVLGTEWPKWDAWQYRAPSFGSQPVANVARKPQPVIVDLLEVEKMEGKNWLAPEPLTPEEKKSIIVKASEDARRRGEHTKLPSKRPSFNRYNPAQPRDSRGRWTGGGSGSVITLDPEKKKRVKEAEAKIMALVDKGLEQFRLFHRDKFADECRNDAQMTLNFMGDDAKLRMAENVKEFHFYSSCRSMTRAVRYKYNLSYDELPRGSQIGGCFEEVSGAIHVDRGRVMATARELYSHEFAHAASRFSPYGESVAELYGKANISDSPSWRAAWRDEIHRPDYPLSEYAVNYGPDEGLAEFARLAWTNPRQAHSQFPQCWHVFEKEGMVPPASPRWAEDITTHAEGDMQALPEIFSEPLRKGGLIGDVLIGVETLAENYSPSQPRDSRGRWSSGGGGGVITPKPKKGPRASMEYTTETVAFDEAEPEQLIQGIAGLPDDLRPMVTAYTADEYRDMGATIRVSDDGASGYAVKPDGELISVYSSVGGRGNVLLEDAIGNGATHLDCFDTYLVDFYSRHGFRETSRLEWSDEYAPQGWDFEKFGRPDVVFMSRNPAVQNWRPEWLRHYS